MLEAEVLQAVLLDAVAAVVPVHQARHIHACGVGMLETGLHGRCGGRTALDVHPSQVVDPLPGGVSFV